MTLSPRKDVLKEGKAKANTLSICHVPTSSPAHYVWYKWSFCSQAACKLQLCSTITYHRKVSWCAKKKKSIQAPSFWTREFLLWVWRIPLLGLWYAATFCSESSLSWYTDSFKRAVNPTTALADAKLETVPTHPTQLYWGHNLLWEQITRMSWQPWSWFWMSGGPSEVEENVCYLTTLSHYF